MKRIFFVFFLTTLSITMFAQDETDGGEEKKTGFQKEKLFTGGDLVLSFSNYGTTLGVSPYFGYSVTKWLDAAVKFNVLYQSQTDFNNTKYKQTNFGPGAFVRLFPVNFLFAQVQYEHNFISTKITPQGSGSYRAKYDVNSLLVGAGYSGGRAEGSNSYFYFSVMFDLAQQLNSPYLDGNGKMLPIISAGYNIGLFQGGGGRTPRSHEH